MRKVLFLDIDGVLNSKQWFDDRKASTEPLILTDLDPAPVDLLKNVLAVTGTDVVLSSTWRLVPHFITAIEEAGIPVSDVTPHLTDVKRCREILSWLWAHPEVYDYAIVDDDPDAAGDCADLLPRFVKTTWTTGLQVQHAEMLIRLLGVK